MVDLFAELPRLFRWRDARAAGITRHRLRQALHTHEVHRVAHGLYQRSAALEDGEPWQLLRGRHLERCAELLALHPGHAASHQTAAALHDLDLRLHPDMPVHLTAIERVPRSRRVEGVTLHHADSVRNDTVEVDGLRATTIARTIADILRTSTPPHSVAVLDGAVRDRRVTAAEVWSVLRRQVRWRGRPRALEAFALHDPTRETWLESYSFVRFYELGLPLPLPQVEILDEGFHLVARVDGLLEETGTFLEADGAGKYLIPVREQGLSEAESVQLSMTLQQQRHDRLLALGLTGARWTTTEAVQTPEAVVSRIRAAMRAGDPATFRGWLRIGGQVMSLHEACRMRQSPTTPWRQVS
ncbi:type IV toxin-antitoxin system AbiEi family antitoxin domain-containing protein [Ornithinicoccus hortensis]|uniref:type IV toxin-antitoxin system AbiEi family antitoxin domain-containing protein n=1 Tax=Ornithinicoccus hortensis TaxID=82346 RepID=UPI0014785654|nr:type IV toxin-antitoxin system AbiEi family antitoxin domain-containing protein [Ornithinicoccus hortensis]